MICWWRLHRPCCWLWLRWQSMPFSSSVQCSAHQLHYQFYIWHFLLLFLRLQAFIWPFYFLEWLQPLPSGGPSIPLPDEKFCIPLRFRYSFLPISQLQSLLCFAKSSGSRLHIPSANPSKNFNDRKSTLNRRGGFFVNFIQNKRLKYYKNDDFLQVFWKVQDSFLYFSKKSCMIMILFLEKR